MKNFGIGISTSFFKEKKNLQYILSRSYVLKLQEILNCAIKFQNEKKNQLIGIFQNSCNIFDNITSFKRDVLLINFQLLRTKQLFATPYTGTHSLFLYLHKTYISYGIASYM